MFGSVRKMGFFGDLVNRAKTAYNNLDEPTGKKVEAREKDVKRYDKLFAFRQAEKFEKTQKSKAKILQGRYDNAAFEAAVKKELTRRINGRDLSDDQRLKLEKTIAKQLKAEIEKDKAETARKQKYNAGVKPPAGYTSKGSYRPNELHLKLTSSQYKRDGYDVIHQKRYDNGGKEIVVLYVKKLQQKQKITVKAGKVKSGQYKKPEYKIFNGKKYQYGGSFRSEYDAKERADKLRNDYGWSLRVSRVVIDGDYSYLVFYRAVEAERRAHARERAEKANEAKKLRSQAKAAKAKEQKRIQQEKANAKKQALKEKKRRQAEAAKAAKTARAKKSRVIFPEKENIDGKSYTINKTFGSDYDRAKTYRKTISANGYNARIVQSDIEGKSVFAVYVRRA